MHACYYENECIRHSHIIVFRVCVLSTLCINLNSFIHSFTYFGGFFGERRAIQFLSNNFNRQPLAGPNNTDLPL